MVMAEELEVEPTEDELEEVEIVEGPKIDVSFMVFNIEPLQLELLRRFMTKALKVDFKLVELIDVDRSDDYKEGEKNG